MFKKSNYNLLIQHTNNNFLIFNTYSGTLAILNTNQKKIYDDIETYNNSLLNDDISFLKDNNFIIDSSIDEFSKICIEEKLCRYDNSNLRLTIAPTMSCNMDCEYCYEKKYSKVMSQDIVNQLLIFIEQLIQKNITKYIEVTWYGGEPLLQPKIIENISQRIISLCHKYNIEYEASIVTNGVLLTSEVASLLKESCNINSAQITIDGLKNTHNKRRPLKNNNDSYDTIISNIDQIKDIIDVLIRVNVDKENLNEINDLFNFFMSKQTWKNKVKMYLYPVIKKQTEACHVNEKSCLSENEFKKLDNYIIRKLFENDAKDSINMLLPTRKHAYCSSICINSFVIDPEGYLYACYDFIGIKEKRIGNIYDTLDINTEYAKWLTINIPDKCNKCELLPLCKGGCPSARLGRDNEPCCDFKYLSLTEKCKIIYEDYLKKESECM